MNVHLSGSICCTAPALAPDQSLILQATPLADVACETNHSLGRTESWWEENKEKILSDCLQPSHKFQHVTSLRVPCTCELCAKQVMSERKSGPVETRLIGPAAMALCWKLALALFPGLRPTSDRNLAKILGARLT